jgi:predicted PilT family ATPase
MEPEISLYTVNGKQYRRSAIEDVASFETDHFEKASSAHDELIDVSCEPIAECRMPALNKHAPEFKAAGAEDAVTGTPGLVAVKEGDSFVAHVVIPPNFFGLIIGKKGATKQQIERETGTKITVPGTKTPIDASAPIVVKGESASAVTDAVRRLQAIAGTSAPS